MKQQLLRRNLQFFWSIGSDPYRQNVCSYLLKTKTFVSLASLLGLTVSQLWLLEWKGVDSLARFDYLGPIFLAFSRMIFLISNVGPLKRLIDGFEDYWPLDKFGEEIREKSQKIHDGFYSVSKAYVTGCTLFILLVSLLPFVTRSKQLFFPMYEPCDLQEFPCFEVLYSWQVFLVFFEFIPAAIAFDTTFLSLTVYPYVGLELLKHGFKQMDLVGTGDKSKENLKEIIRQHNVILDSIDELDRLFSTSLMVQFVCGLVSQIFALYMLTEDGIPPDSTRVSRYGFIYIAYLSQLLIYSFAGMILIEQTASVANEAYAVDWSAKTHPDLRKSLAFVILRSQKPSKIKIGKLADLDLVSYLSVVRGAFSVYTLLRQFREEKLENTQ